MADGAVNSLVDTRRRVPRTDAVLADPRLVAAVERLGRDRVKAAVTAAQERVRRGELGPDAVADAVHDALPARACSMSPVLNATGVVLHT
ncbi:MAG: L-seryl-tRNA(Sec) selenium transferase, partial [Actinomycetota bacterium]|nr:L-seryl-tRNA(Sec) selenium transferase [Actinomycetota bacterium]